MFGDQPKWHTCYIIKYMYRKLGGLSPANMQFGKKCFNNAFGIHREMKKIL